MIALVAAACTNVPPDRPRLVIGVLTTTYGEGAARDSSTEHGAELAIEIVNNAHESIPMPLAAGRGLPRLGGAMLALATADSEGRAELAVKRAGELASDRHALGVVLADSAEVAAATASEMQRLRTPLLDAGSSADYLTELGLDWYFRIGPSDRALAETSLTLIRRYAAAGAANPIAAVIEPGGEGAAGSALLSELAGREDRKIATVEWTQTNLDSGVFTARTNGAPAILAWAHSTAGATAITRALTTGAAAPLIGLGSGFRRLAQPPSGAPLILRPVAWSPELAQRTPVAQAIAQLYQQRFGTPMNGAAAAGFTAVYALAVAINDAGSRDPAAVRAALRQNSLLPTQMIMPWNGIRFTADGTNSLAAPVVEAWDGEGFRVVYPAELATRPLPWPERTP